MPAGMLPDRVKGGLRPSQSIQWQREDGTAENLTGATLTGTITNRATATTRANFAALIALGLSRL